MKEEKAKKIIKNYILENFDDSWCSDVYYLKEYSDFYVFSINSKKYFRTGDYKDCYIGYGSAFLSKKFNEIVHYGSGQFSIEFKDFLTTEHKLNIIRTKHKLSRIDYTYEVSILKITNENKASKYINWLFNYYNKWSYLEVKENLKFPSLTCHNLINLLYFNIVDPFCEITFKYIENENTKKFKKFNPIFDISEKDLPFQEYMYNQVKLKYPQFRLDKAYRVIISEVYNKNKLQQYATVAGFSYYGYDVPTGYTGFIPYRRTEIEVRIQMNNRSFEYVEGNNILFFLFINTLNPFCKIEFDKAQDIVDS